MKAFFVARTPWAACYPITRVPVIEYISVNEINYSQSAAGGCEFVVHRKQQCCLAPMRLSGLANSPEAAPLALQDAVAIRAAAE
jgi:hypothetical protein